jgi:lycopene cyclase domain-containing protein
MIYIYLLLAVLAIAIFLQRKYKIHLYRSYKEELIYISALLALFIPCDIYAVNKGVWAFPGNGLLGLYFYTLPVEEIIFMVIIPYFSIILYKVIHKHIRS